MASECGCNQDVERWRRELRAAGWEERTHFAWRAPNGSLHLGPHGAWHTMTGTPRVVNCGESAAERSER